jgi:glutamine cyclotransferase
MATEGDRAMPVMETIVPRKPRDTSVPPAEIVREYGPYPGQNVHGVTHDGRHVWLARGDSLAAIDPGTGDVVRELAVAGDAGTAFDGQHLWQIADARIHKIDPATGAVVASIPAPAQGCDSGLAWAEGTLWVGEYRARRIHQVDPVTGAVLRTLESDRFVTGVSWTHGELWHGTFEDDRSELRRIDPATGEVLARAQMPDGVAITGLESDGGELFYCGGGSSRRVRAVKKPR